MLVHHVKFVDGSVEHREFSRDGWEWAMKAAEVVDHWGHPPDRCVDPIEEVRGRALPSSVSPRDEVAELIETKQAQIRKIVEESRKGGQLPLVFE